MNDLSANTPEHSWQILLRCLSRMGKQGLALAISGGVDSTLLALAIKEAGVAPFHAYTFCSALTTDQDKEAVCEVVEALSVEHRFVSFDPLSLPALANNRKDRCYHCKKHMMSLLRELAQAEHIPVIVDGSNADDLRDYRPGNKAALELEVRHPLAECGIPKATVRALAQAKGLPTYNRPSTPCLASRFPYDTPLEAGLLAKVAQGEALLRQMGFAALRLRVHGDLLRIEVPEQALNSVVANRLALTAALRNLGFPYITLDLDGLIPGRFDRPHL